MCLLRCSVTRFFSSFFALINIVHVMALLLYIFMKKMNLENNIYVYSINVETFYCTHPSAICGPSCFTLAFYAIVTQRCSTALCFDSALSLPVFTFTRAAPLYSALSRTGLSLFSPAYSPVTHKSWVKCKYHNCLNLNSYTYSIS